MLTRAALKNPYAVFAFCMIALVLGGVSYQKMRVDIFPDPPSSSPRFTAG